MANELIPRADQAVLTWGQGCVDTVAADPAAYRVSAEEAEEFVQSWRAFAAASAVANDPTLRTGPAVFRKDECKKAFVSAARILIRMITGDPRVTQEAKSRLGLRPRRRPTRRAVPVEAPRVTPTAVGFTWLKVRVRPAGGVASRPSWAEGCELFTWIGADPPTDLGAWRARGARSRTRAVLEFGPGVEPGTPVWVAARWFNRRGVGLFSSPLTLRLSGSPFAGRGDVGGEEDLPAPPATIIADAPRPAAA